MTDSNKSSSPTLEQQAIDSLSFELFNDLVSSTFVLNLGEQKIEMELVEASRLGNQRDNQPRAGFVIMFQLPREFQLAQGNYVVSHAKIGSFAIFLVPVMPSEWGPRLEAVFN